MIVPSVVCLLVQSIRLADPWYQKNGEYLALAAEATAAYFLYPTVGPDSVLLTAELEQLAAAEGISLFDLQAIIAAATSEGIPPETLLGLAKVETNYCRNLGRGIAYDEVKKRLDSAEERQYRWWQRNLDSLVVLAEQLDVEVSTIPGSKGAGAISCFQLMPINWMTFGAGDYRQTFTAAINSGRFLNAAGFQEDPGKAIGSYNPGAGQSYVDSVLTASAVWTGVTGAVVVEVEEPLKPTPLITLMVYLEFLAWYTGDQMVGGPGTPGPGPIPPVPAGAFVHPYPGSVATSYHWLQPVYYNGVFLINHPGQDYGGISGGQIVAAHAGRVTYAEFLSQHTELAGHWWISGNVVVIRSDFPDGTPLCTFYGHGAPGSIIVSVGNTVAAGQKLMDAGTTGFSSEVHLHFAVKIGGSGDHCEGGSWADPNGFVP